jgi:SAM-dependent methyltransferase
MASCFHLRQRLAARFMAGVGANSGGDYASVLARYKRELFARLRGTVLEIGPGAGANLAWYPRDIRWIGLEPNPYMHPYLRRAAARLGLPVDLRSGAAERIDADDRSVDFVVGTLVLCSVDDPRATLREIARVLRPGGQYLFIEHVAAPRGTRLRRVQDLLQPPWTFVADGCHPNRETWAAIEGAGFAHVSYERFSTPVFPVGPHIAGAASV